MSVLYDESSDEVSFVFLNAAHHGISSLLLAPPVLLQRIWHDLTEDHQARYACTTLSRLSSS